MSRQSYDFRRPITDLDGQEWPKDWDDYLQATPSTQDAFTTYLRRKAREEEAEYTFASLPWYQRIDWREATTILLLVTTSVTVTTLAVIGLFTVAT